MALVKSPTCPSFGWFPIYPMDPFLVSSISIFTTPKALSIGQHLGFCFIFRPMLCSTELFYGWSSCSHSFSHTYIYISISIYLSVCLSIDLSIYLSGWWFGTGIWFFHSVGNVIIQLTNSYFSEGLKPPTSIYSKCIYIYIYIYSYIQLYSNLYRYV